MTIRVDHGVLEVSGAQSKLRQKGREQPAFLADYTLIDIETTGLSPTRDRVTELGGLKVRNGQVVATYSHLVKFPDVTKVPPFLTQLNGIDSDQIEANGIAVDQAISDYRTFIGQDVIVGYNVNFDLNFVYDLAHHYRQPALNNDYVDVLRLARVYYPFQRHNRLIDCMTRLGIAESQQHRGLDDCLDTKKVYDCFQDVFTDELLFKAQDQLKSFDLTSEQTASWGYSPFTSKYVVFAGDFALNLNEAKQLMNRLGGKVQDHVDRLTDYVILGDHDFFKKDLEANRKARQLKMSGARLHRWSETWFLSVLDDWARR